MDGNCDMAKKKKTETFRDRIKEHRRVKASTIKPHPENFREHPTAQSRAMTGVLEEVGISRSLLGYDDPEWGLVLLDGHLRQEIYGDQDVEIEVLNVTRDEARKILATLDPLATMAATNTEKLDELLKNVTTETAEIQALLDSLSDKPADHIDLAEQKIQLEYSVLIKCQNEGDQTAILKELDKHGLDTRAICAGFPETEPKEKSAAPKIQSTGRLITRTVAIERTPRVKQLEGIFDVSPSKKMTREWRIDFDLDRDWSIGLIVGPSGSGKTTLAKELFGKDLIAGWEWPKDNSVVDGFPTSMSIHDITGLLSSVGFSSPPSWLKPFHVLSNGEQFRVTLARTLAESPDLAVVDEFTSVVDRTVAQIGSAALAKTIRNSGRRFVAIACHYDIEEWLQPDWKYDTASGEFLWRSLRQRPSLCLSIRRADASAWKLFSQHHYLSSTLARTAYCFVGEIDERSVAFASAIHNPHKGRGWWREHRTVCLPDFQGIGIGNALSEFVAGLMVATGKEYRSTTSHPSMIRHRNRSILWEMIRPPAMHTAPSGKYGPSSVSAWDRVTAGFRYIGPPNKEMAKQFGII
jgi:Acetyltransferase (GNAT) family